MLRCLVTGNAGFIGYHLAWKLLARGDAVVGFDSVNDYYDPQLKESRLARLSNFSSQQGADYVMLREDLVDKNALDACFASYKFDRVIHLAAQAGVRHSLDHPLDYVQSNLVGFTNLLQACRHHQVAHLTYASTSSVYGGHSSMPLRESMAAVHPLQLYAATKRANELMAHSYSHLFSLPTTALRFFTVYGPWGRPDMALFLFTRNILEGKPIEVFNQGLHTRDFTYVDDIVEGIICSSDRPAEPNPEWDSVNPAPDSSSAPFRIYNIGNNRPVRLLEYITAIEKATGKQAIKDMKPLQPGDIHNTCADTSQISLLGYTPTTSIQEGVGKFVDWYKKYYQPKV